MAVFAASPSADERAAEMPCPCDLQGRRPTGRCFVLAAEKRGRVKIERLMCDCGQRFTRIWVAD
jgi:hypothetical protein